jgi:hypothetical protein
VCTTFSLRGLPNLGSFVIPSDRNRTTVELQNPTHDSPCDLGIPPVHDRDHQHHDRNPKTLEKFDHIAGNYPCDT